MQANQSQPRESISLPKESISLMNQRIMAQAQLQNAPTDVEMSYTTLCRKVYDIVSSVQGCRDVGL